MPHRANNQKSALTTIDANGHRQMTKKAHHSSLFACCAFGALALWRPPAATTTAAAAAAQKRRHAEGARHRRRRRQPRPRLLVLPDRLPGARQHDAALALRLEAGRDQADARPRRGPARGLQRRQDRHDQDQGRHQVQPAAPEPDRQGGRRQVRARALLPAAGRQRLRERLLRRHRGREGVHRTARPTRSPASRRRTTRRS